MHYLIEYYSLPADRIVVPKSWWNLVQHHAIYLGQDYSGIDWIMECKEGFGVRTISAETFFNESSKITQIISFFGTKPERVLAIKRALNQAGKSYNLINFNCEHIANYIQSGIIISNQIKNVGIGLAVIAAFTILSSEN